MIAAEQIDHLRDWSAALAPYTTIENDAQYQEAVTFLDSLMAQLTGEDDPLTQTMSLVGEAISAYEGTLAEVKAFEKSASEERPDIAVLKFLMEQYTLDGSSFSEIGDKSVISRVLKGERSLTRHHIGRLCKRFRLSPRLFFPI